MAWPLSRLTTYLFKALPVIKSADLNAIQDAIIGLCNGTLTLKSLIIDGTGGATGAPAAGEIHVSRVVADANTPSGAATNKGQIYKESLPTTKATFAVAGPTTYWGYGVHSIVRNGDGDYTVTCKEVPTGNDPSKTVVHVTAVTDEPHDYIAVTKSVDGSNRFVARVLFKNAANDIDFDFTATVM